MDSINDLSTRWDVIPNGENAYRLLCSHPTCSLSCANLKNGKLSTTSVHGIERHSYELSKNDMCFLTLMFLISLTKQELDIFLSIYNDISSEKLFINKK